MPRPSRVFAKTSDLIPAASTFNRWVLDVLVVFNVLAQVVLLLVFLLGHDAMSVAPIAGGAVISLFLLMFFYARWLVPVLNRRQIITVIMLKELGIFVLLGLVVGLVALLRWIF